MNYVEVTQKRQQAALSRLLLGQRRAEREFAEESEKERDRIPEAWKETPVFRDRTGGELPAAEYAARESEAQTTGRVPLSIREAREAETRIRGAAAAEMAAISETGETPEEVLLQWRGSSAEQLSRTFQRDSRRYDGGFFLY